MLIRATTVAVALFVSACATSPIDPDRVNPGPKPADPKAILQTYLKRNLFDPYTVRDASITDVVEGQIWFVHGWLVCVRLNAKNRMGGYAGLSTTAYLLKHDEVVDQLENAPVCDTMKFTPWPDMDEH